MKKNGEYDEIRPYSEGRAAVCKGVLWVSVPVSLPVAVPALIETAIEHWSPL